MPRIESSARLCEAVSSLRHTRAISAPNHAPWHRAAGVGAALVSASRTVNTAVQSPPRSVCARCCRAIKGAEVDR